MESWKAFYEIIKVLYEASGMNGSPTKYGFLRCGVTKVFTSTKNLFPFKSNSIDNNFKYLGHFLKPENYLTKDWNWLVKKVEIRINNWCYRWIPMGGRLW